MGWEQLDGSSSICVQSDFAPISYWWYPSHEGRNLPDEVRAVVSTMGLGPDDAERLFGEFLGTLRALVFGNLTPRKNIKGPMDRVSNLEVFEVRASIEYGESQRAELRAYHVEPGRFAHKGGSTVIGLHVHAKDLSADSVNAAQDAEIDRSAERFFEGRAGRWGGLPLSPATPAV